MRRASYLVVAAFAACLCGTTLAAPGASIPEEKTTNRSIFFPELLTPALPGRLIGVLIREPMEADDLAEAADSVDAIAFSYAGSRYMRPYVPASDDAAAEANREFRIGLLGDARRVFSSVAAATKTNANERWGIESAFALVELEVNNGEGSPSNEDFVATKMRQLDGTKFHPARLQDTIESAKKRFRNWRDAHKELHETSMTKSCRIALDKQMKVGPANTQENVYATWMPDTRLLRVRFLVEVSATAEQACNQPEPVRITQFDKRFPAPALPPVGPIKWHTRFGIRYGVCFDFDKHGNLAKIQTLPPESLRDKTWHSTDRTGIDERPFPGFPPLPVQNREGF